MSMEHTAHEEQEHGLNPRQYLLIGAILTVITAVELVVSYSELGDLMIPILFLLSGVKFAAVVAFFMHLRFEARLFQYMFVGPLILAGAVLIALITLFWTDVSTLFGG